MRVDGVRGVAPELTRRGALALALLPLLPARPASALFGIGGPAGPVVEFLSRQEVCQARAQVQDFVAIRYTGRFEDGRVFDSRYAEQPLVYQLGSFYLPGVDSSLAGACVGSKMRLRWASSPNLPRLEDAAGLPEGSAIEMDLEFVTIKYSLFGETMRDPKDDYFFAPGPITLSSVFTTRGHASGLTPRVKRDNPFALGPTEDSIISNSQGVLKPMIGDGFGIPAAESAGEMDLQGSGTGKDG